jgi:hypothetical protein
MANVIAKTENELHIVPYTLTDHKVEDACVHLQHTLEQTKVDINHRQGKRGNIVYRPDEKTIESYGRRMNVELQADKMKISGFSRPLDIDS